MFAALLCAQCTWIPAPEVYVILTLCDKLNLTISERKPKARLLGFDVHVVVRLGKLRLGNMGE